MIEPSPLTPLGESKMRALGYLDALLITENDEKRKEILKKVIDLLSPLQPSQ